MDRLTLDLQLRSIIFGLGVYFAVTLKNPFCISASNTIQLRPNQPHHIGLFCYVAGITTRCHCFMATGMENGIPSMHHVGLSDDTDW